MGNPKPFIVQDGGCCSSTSTTIVGVGRDSGSFGRGGATVEAGGRASGLKTDLDSGRASPGKRRSVGRSLRVRGQQERESTESPDRALAHLPSLPRHVGANAEGCGDGPPPAE